MVLSVDCVIAESDIYCSTSGRTVNFKTDRKDGVRDSILSVTIMEKHEMNVQNAPNYAAISYNWTLLNTSK